MTGRFVGLALAVGLVHPLVAKAQLGPFDASLPPFPSPPNIPPFVTLTDQLV